MTKKKVETKEKSAAPEKKTQQVAWISSKPERPGLYNCRVNGKELPLQFKVCQFTQRSYWMNVDGTDVDPNAKVEWREGKVEL